MSTPSKLQSPEDEKVAASRPPTAPARSATSTGADMLRSRPSFDLETLLEIAERKKKAAPEKDSGSTSSSTAATPHSPFDSMSTPLKQQPPEDEKTVSAAAARSHSRPPTPPARSATSTDTDALRGVHSPRPNRPFGLHWVKEYSAGSSSLSEEGSGTAEKGDTEAEASLSPAMCATPPPSAGKAKESVKLPRNDKGEEGAVKKLVCSSSWAAPSIDELIVQAAREPLMVEEAWERLRSSIVFYRGKPVGTLAAMDPNAADLNYNQVFVRDFVPAGLAYLMKNPSEPDIVKNFLLKTLHLQGHEKMVDNFTLGEGVLPASFKVSFSDSPSAKEMVVADFGGHAIGRVAPVDSGFWWIILLRAYVKSTNDHALAELPEVQNGMKLILKLCLSDGFDTFPTLLCADGCCMIDRRMGIYGYPIEIQALFYFALRCARELLKPKNDGEELLKRIDNRIKALSFHIQNYYWLDFTQLNNIYRYKTEEYSHTAVNKFNVMPESIPDWVIDFMPSRGGYLIGNVSPARMDFRWFLVGNCIAILSCLATPDQAEAIMNLIEERWDKLIGEMPLKIAYPALEGHEWRIITGCDSKNTQWSYHNGGSWPTLLWLLAAACIKTRRRGMAMKAINLAEQRLSKDGWPEYYDGKTGRYIGKQARKYQTWSMSGYLIAKMLIENPTNCSLISLEEDTRNAQPRHNRSTSV